MKLVMFKFLLGMAKTGLSVEIIFLGSPREMHVAISL